MRRRFVLIGVAVVVVAAGLFFAFRALANGHAGDADVAFVGGALTTGIAAFGVQALFGTPGLEDEGPAD